jgi:diguanylate cyclase (GGDEF)-like protein
VAAEPSPRSLGGGWRSWLGRYSLLMIALVLLTVSLALSFHRIRQQHETELVDVGLSLWLTTQADFELQRLRHALDAYALGSREVDQSALLQRFEIFWSRLPLLIEGIDSGYIQSVPSAALVPQMIADMERLEPQMLALQPADEAGYRRIADTLDAIVEPLGRLTQETKNAVGLNSDEQQQRQRALYLEQIAYLLGVLVSGSIVIALLVRETRRVRRLLAEATTARSRIWHLAHHDPLTDLPNRWLFNDRLDQALRRGQREGEMVALHYFDLDDFKAVNDGFGHLTGDRVLVAVAQRLNACVRHSDTLARIGGDEFAVVQAGASGRAGAVLLAERMLAALAPPLAIDGHRLRIRASIGIGLYPDHGASPVQLHQAADQALYQAKASGNASVRVWEPGHAARFPQVAAG